ncbi:MAG: HIT domain-containing protein [Candidatus Sedimenticola endophacoides]
MFQLHPRLAADTLPLGRLDLCEARLMNDCRFPWVILVPRREGITELHQLGKADQTQLLAESARVAAQLQSLGVEKINLGALGNLVPQLHWHLVGRRRDDPCWPGPAWGCGKSRPWNDADARTLLLRLRRGLGLGEERP